MKSVDEISYQIEPRSHVAIFETGGGLSTETLVTLMNKIRRPTPNDDGSIGKVFIGEVALDQIGAKCKLNYYL